MAQTELIADGKRHGIAITDYLLERIRDRRLMPAVVVDVIGATLHKHANEMLAEGISREDVATWVQTGPPRVARAGDGGSSPRVNSAFMRAPGRDLHRPPRPPHPGREQHRLRLCLRSLLHSVPCRQRQPLSYPLLR